MDIILCHTTADFDALGAAVGLTRLQPGAKIVLPGGAHPPVRDFLALHRDQYALIERRAVNPEEIRKLVVVDTQKRDRLGKAAEWLDLPQLSEIFVYDHHVDIGTDIPITQAKIAPVGATTTIVVEELQLQQIDLTPVEATVMALGIHVDTGSLTFAGTTARDATALAWLMQQGANLHLIGQYIEPGLSAQLQTLLTKALNSQQVETRWGYTVTWVLLETDGYVPGLSGLASQLMELTQSDALLLGAHYRGGELKEERLTVIGRSQIQSTNLNELFQPLGGGGHQQAASVSLRGVDPPTTLKQLVDQFLAQIPHPPIARDLMSSPVRTIVSSTTIEAAQRVLLRYGHSGLCVVDAEQLVGIVSRRNIDIALHHGFSQAPVQGYMTTSLKTISPETTLPEIQTLMVTYDIGRLPVLQSGQLIGIVTRTDVLRELHQLGSKKHLSTHDQHPVSAHHFLSLLRLCLAAPFWELLNEASSQAEQRGWHLYLVGGAVRDLLLAKDTTTRNLTIQDIDLVVDGFHKSADVGAGVELARALQPLYPGARLEVHGAFQTAALLWHQDQALGSLWVDIATARTEFYAYPAANPQVEASSIRQDLYRRDFTINALAVRLTSPRSGELLDFFGGLLDLQAQQIRVLHANSFIEDPTRIYRAVKFAVRLGFAIEPQTEGYIRYAIKSGICDRTQGEHSHRPALQTRLKSELKYILQAPYWQAALQLLGELGALQCIHPTLELNKQLWLRLRRLKICLRRFDSNNALNHWLMRLEVMITYLAPQYRHQVASDLQLPDDSTKRLLNLAQSQAEVIASLPLCQLPSQLVQLLRRYDLQTLILLAVQSQRPIRRPIWQYLTLWAKVEPPLNGNDLKALGYKPGPQYRQILEGLLAATLDGVISTSDLSLQETRTAARAFVLANYPQHVK